MVHEHGRQVDQFAERWQWPAAEPPVEADAQATHAGHEDCPTGSLSGGGRVDEPAEATEVTDARETRE